MSENCDNNCAGCSQDCAERQQPRDLRAHLHPDSSVKRVIGVVSGKGGVGKSLVTSLLAVSAARAGLRCAVLDADITGPSIAHAFGITGKALGDGQHILPRLRALGIQIMSINMLLENDTDPVLWRGPILAGAVKQFYSEVLWQDVDVMFVDLPPGTGDVPLTVFQSLPLDGIIVVTSPQELVGMVVGKAVKMAQMMNIPIIGIVENMSYFRCPDNDKDYQIFGASHIEDIASEYNLKVLAKIPIDPHLSSLSDLGLIELFKGSWLDKVPEVLEKL